jgi:hypothetical protein
MIPGFARLPIPLFHRLAGEKDRGFLELPQRNEASRHHVWHFLSMKRALKIEAKNGTPENRHEIAFACDYVRRREAPGTPY